MSIIGDIIRRCNGEVIRKEDRLQKENIITNKTSILCLQQIPSTTNP